ATSGTGVDLEGSRDGTPVFGKSGTRASHDSLCDWNATRHANRAVVGPPGGSIHLLCELVTLREYPCKSPQISRLSPRPLERTVAPDEFTVMAASPRQPARPTVARRAAFAKP